MKKEDTQRPPQTSGCTIPTHQHPLSLHTHILKRIGAGEMAHWLKAWPFFQRIGLNTPHPHGSSCHSVPGIQNPFPVSMGTACMHMVQIYKRERVVAHRPDNLSLIPNPKMGKARTKSQAFCPLTLHPQE